MIVGGLLIASALFIYYTHYPKEPLKGSLSYYKQQWKLL